MSEIDLKELREIFSTNPCGHVDAHCVGGEMWAQHEIVIALLDRLEAAENYLLDWRCHAEMNEAWALELKAQLAAYRRLERDVRILSGLRCPTCDHEAGLEAALSALDAALKGDGNE